METFSDPRDGLTLFATAIESWRTAGLATSNDQVSGSPAVVCQEIVAVVPLVMVLGVVRVNALAKGTTRASTLSLEIIVVVFTRRASFEVGRIGRINPQGWMEGNRGEEVEDEDVRGERRRSVRTVVSLACAI